MKKLLCVATLSILSTFSACGGSTGTSAPSDSPPSTSSTHDSPPRALTPPNGYSPLQLKPGAELITYGDCDLAAANCPAHTYCAWVFLDTGTIGPRCVPSHVCELLACGGGSCLILDSDPAQVVCRK